MDGRAERQICIERRWDSKNAFVLYKLLNMVHGVNLKTVIIFSHQSPICNLIKFVWEKESLWDERWIMDFCELNSVVLQDKSILL